MAYIIFTIHIFPSDYNCNQSVNILQRLHHNLTVARLLHKYAYSFVKYSQNVAYKWHFSKETFLFETYKYSENYELVMYLDRGTLSDTDTISSF